MNERVSSSSDDRTVNNVVRHEYRVLSAEEKAEMQRLKDMGASLIGHMAFLRTNKPSAGRELSLAITKAEEAIMWAVKGLTA